MKAPPTEINISIIIPVHNETENIKPVAEEITSVFSRESWSWECIWIDDGSTDQTPARLQQLVEMDRRHLFLSLSKNVGKSAALYAGFKTARGEIIATMDGDGQNDPMDLIGFIRIIQAGLAEMVTGYRARRRDSRIKRLSSVIGNSFRNRVTGVVFRDAGCPVKAFKAECAEHMPLFNGLHRFISTNAVINGFRVMEKPVKHRPRISGQSKYNIRNRLWVGLVDCFGMLWLKKRAIRYRLAQSSNKHTGPTGR